MSGHSQFANIKHRKEAQDSKRQKKFQKIMKELSVAIKEGKSNDPKENPKLRLAVEKAKSSNMPKDVIERCLNKGNDDKKDYKEIVYEGYAPGGVALLVECLTDNHNRTSSFIKSTFSKNGGSIGTPGSVSYLFTINGVIEIKKPINFDLEILFELVIDQEIIDIYEKEESVVLLINPKDLLKVKEILETKEQYNNFLVSEIKRIPLEKLNLEESKKESLMNLISILEENEDVQHVYTNASI